MRYFEKNVEADNEPSKNIYRLMSAASAVASNAVFVAANGQDEAGEVTSCKALYTVIGYCESMLAAFPEDVREKALGAADGHFGGECERRRREADAAIESIFSRVFG